MFTPSLTPTLQINCKALWIPPPDIKANSNVCLKNQNGVIHPHTNARFISLKRHPHFVTTSRSQNPPKKLSTANQNLPVQIQHWHLGSMFPAPAPQVTYPALCLLLVVKTTKRTLNKLLSPTSRITSIYEKDTAETILGSENSLGSPYNHYFKQSHSCLVLPLSTPLSGSQLFFGMVTWLLTWLGLCHGYTAALDRGSLAPKPRIRSVIPVPVPRGCLIKPAKLSAALGHHPSFPICDHHILLSLAPSLPLHSTRIPSIPSSVTHSPWSLS